MFTGHSLHSSIFGHPQFFKILATPVRATRVWSAAHLQPAESVLDVVRSPF